MHWYEQKHDIDGVKVTVHGSFKDSQLKIYAMIDWPDELEHVKLYHKTLSMWKHQEILAEDVLAKYQGQVKKFEDKLPNLVEQAKLKRRI